MVFKPSFKVIVVSRKCQFTVESGEEIESVKFFYQYNFFLPCV